MNRIVMLRFKSTHLAGCEPGLEIKTNRPLRPRRVRRIYFIRLQHLSIVDKGTKKSGSSEIFSLDQMMYQPVVSPEGG
jgi:hypothetical protein